MACRKRYDRDRKRLERFGQKLTVYGGSAPRLSLFAEKGRSPAEQALELLEIMTKKAKIPA